MPAATLYSIVGSGNVGSALAQLFDRAGIKATIANTRGPESMRDIVGPLSANIRAVALEEALLSDVVFMAIPFAAVKKFGALLPDWSGKTIIDTVNAFYSPGSTAVLDGRLSTHYVAENLPGADVVKAFNHLPATTLATALDPELGKRVIFIAADSPDAADRIAVLVEKLGLAAVQLGRIDEGGALINVPNALVLRNFLERPLH